MKLQIIVTTMYQTDFSLLGKMNIDTDVIVANQASENKIETKQLKRGTAIMITTDSRGLSRNRNIGLEFLSKACDYVMFADDDLVFYDNYLELIEKEFKNHPEANAIKFNLDELSKNRKLSMRRTRKFHKATRRSVSASGVCGGIFKKEYLIKYNLRFNEYFGAGTENYCGEDTIFLQEVVNKNIGLYLSPVAISGIDQTESTWFDGYNEKYFYVTGKVFAIIYPRIAKVLAVRSAYRFSKRPTCKLPFTQILKSYIKGINEIKKG